jgi:hypothetical protein
LAVVAKPAGGTARMRPALITLVIFRSRAQVGGPTTTQHRHGQPGQ